MRTAHRPTDRVVDERAEALATLVQHAARLAQLEQHVTQLLAANLPARVAVLERRRTRRDPDEDGRRLSALAGAFGGQVFSACEIADVLGERDGRKIGAWLRHVRRHPTDPYGLDIIGRDHRGTLWVLRVRV